MNGQAKNLAYELAEKALEYQKKNLHSADIIEALCLVLGAYAGSYLGEKGKKEMVQEAIVYMVMTHFKNAMEYQKKQEGENQCVN